MEVGALFNYSPDGTRLSVTSPDGRLSIWNSASEAFQQYSPSAHLSTQITALAWCPASQLNTPKKEKKNKNESRGGTANLIALGTTAGTVLMYSVQLGDVVTTLEASLSTVRIQALAWSHSCKSIFVGAEDGMVSIFSVMELKLNARFKAGKEPVYSLAVTSDDKYLVTGCRNIKVWEIKNQTLIQTFIGHANEVRRLCSVLKDGSHYFLSAAAEDRNISVWQLGEPSKKKAASYLTLSVNESVEDIGALVADDEVISTVTTTEGSVQVFRFSLDGARSAPIKCASVVQIAAEGDKKVSKVQLCASACLNKDDPTLQIAYGSSSALQLEELKVNDLLKIHLLTRTPPVLNLGGETVKEFTKVVKPKIPEAVKFLKAGSLPGPEVGDSSTVVTPGGGRKRKQQQEETDANLSLEERLSFLKPNQTKSYPKSDTLAQLLVQGLQSKDQSILNGVLDRDDDELMSRTLATLPIECVVPLLRHLYSDIKNKGAGNVSLIKWAFSLVKAHSGYLVSSPKVLQEILIPMNQMLEHRTSNYMQIVKLKSKMELIREQMSRNKSGVNLQTDRPSLLVYQDDSEDEYEDVLKDIIIPSEDADVDSDYLDEINAGGDKDDDDDDSDDDDDNDEEMNGLQNGHASSSDMDED
jgi:U3 small nucleolar RNA-associated protein 5